MGLSREELKARERAAKLWYLEQFLHLASREAMPSSEQKYHSSFDSLRDRVYTLFEERKHPEGKTGEDHELTLDRLYREVRDAEHKVPSLVPGSFTSFPSDLSSSRGYPSLSKRTETPTLSFSGSLEEALLVYHRPSLVSVSFDGVSVAAFSSEREHHVGQLWVLEEEGITGHIYLNSDFAWRTDIPKHIERSSAMRNVAKAFFNLGTKTCVTLLQYLRPDATSSEHYHTLPECIIQLGGSSVLDIRPINQDTERTLVELHSGDRYTIPGNTLHRVRTEMDGSLTMPVKETIVGRKDHHYPLRSADRIAQEVHELLLLPHYNSGQEMAEVLEDYGCELRPEERRVFITTVSNRLATEQNPNIAFVLQRLLSLSPDTHQI